MPESDVFELAEGPPLFDGRRRIFARLGIRQIGVFIQDTDGQFSLSCGGCMFTSKEAYLVDELSSLLRVLNGKG